MDAPEAKKPIKPKDLKRVGWAKIENLKSITSSYKM